MTWGEARRDALLALGGVTQTTDAYRDRRSVPFLETTMRDLRYAVRMLRNRRGFPWQPSVSWPSRSARTPRCTPSSIGFSCGPFLSEADRLGTIVNTDAAASDDSYNNSSATWIAMRDAVRISIWLWPREAASPAAST
jgi:hypothetical protein